MTKNMGSVDKIVRSVLAITFLSLYLTDVLSGTLGIVFVALSGIFLLTSFISVCPLYLPFGIKTCRVK